MRLKDFLKGVGEGAGMAFMWFLIYATCQVIEALTTAQ